MRGGRETRHAAELERLALVVASSAGRDEALDEVLASARRLLDVDGCALYRPGDGAALAASGETPATLPGVEQQGGGAGEGARTFLAVSVPAGDGDGNDVLAVCTAEARHYSEEELHLAEVLAAFAALARTLGRQHTLLRGVLHELVTPLACVTGFADALLGRWDRLEDSERRELVVKIRHHGAELSDLVDQLADLAAVQAGRLGGAPAAVDLAAECAAVTDLLRPLLEGRPVRVDVPAITLTVDARLLRRTLTNLLSNAAKYSPAGSSIALTGETNAGEVHLRITDQGAGMTPEEVSRAFEAFWRGAVPDGVRGAGIGLSLVREYVDAMGGRIEVRSAPARGSTFTLTLPVELPVE